MTNISGTSLLGTRFWYIVGLVSAFLLLVVHCSQATADFTFVQISDTHVGVNEQAFNSRFREVIKQINALSPAFVIHTGDVLTTWSEGNAKLFKEISKELRMPMYLLPGNHDITDARGSGEEKTNQKIEAWKNMFGADRFSFEHDGCVFIGLNSNLWNTGYGIEKTQLQWLESELRKAKGKRIFVFEHHPMFLDTPNDPNGNYFMIDNPARKKVLNLLAGHKVEAFLAGHYHRHLASKHEGTSFLTTPAVSFSCAADKGLTGYSIIHVFPGGFTHHFVDLRVGGSPPEF